MTELEELQIFQIISKLEEASNLALMLFSRTDKVTPQLPLEIIAEPTCHSKLFYVKKFKPSKKGFAKWYCGNGNKASSDIRTATPVTEQQIDFLMFASGTEYYPVQYINQYKTSVLAKVIASKLDESKCKYVQPF